MRETIELWERLDCALVGIGLRHVSSDANAAAGHEQGMMSAVGDVIRHYFDFNGTVIPWEGEKGCWPFQPISCVRQSFDWAGRSD